MLLYFISAVKYLSLTEYVSYFEQRKFSVFSEKNFPICFFNICYPFATSQNRVDLIEGNKNCLFSYRQRRKTH